MDFKRWWDANPDERFWLEITDRDDLGVDLNAPQRRDDGEEYFGYSLIWEVRNGNMVFHYHKGRKAIVAVSRSSGGVWADDVLWAAHGTAARSAGIRPYKRPGWRLGLDAFQALDTPVTLDELRSRQTLIQAVRDHLEETYGNPIYFPFEPPTLRDLRPTQAYITKLPVAVVHLFPALAEAVHQLEIATSKRHQGNLINDNALVTSLGIPYRSANEEFAISGNDPFSVDPALVERANRGHAIAQNALASYLISCGIEPRSPKPDEPNYDLAWVDGEVVYVAEVKSLNEVNEEKQLRLGLGQLLRYRHLLGKRYATVRAVLMAEHDPQDQSWAVLCTELNVQLISPVRIQSLDLKRTKKMNS